MKDDVVRRASGRWKGILMGLGVSDKFLSGKNTECPFCGGKDRFRFVDKKGDGFWVCNVCGHGDGFNFIEKLKGVTDFREIVKLVNEHIGGAPVDLKPPQDDAHRLRELNRLWGGSVPVLSSNLAGKYFLSRGLSVDERITELRYFEPDRLILSRVCDETGVPITVQRTYLDENGVKLKRSTFWGSHPKGCAVRLLPPTKDGTLGVAEGVETAMSAAKLYQVPVWATLTAMHLENWKRPDEVKRVLIFGDNDASFTGQAAMFALAKRMKLQDKVEVEPMLPLGVDEDWNDVLLESLHKTS